jgi:hypothetical protein
MVWEFASRKALPGKIIIIISEFRVFYFALERGKK